MTNASRIVIIPSMMKSLPKDYMSVTVFQSVHYQISKERALPSPTGYTPSTRHFMETVSKKTADDAANVADGN